MYTSLNLHIIVIILAGACMIIGLVSKDITYILFGIGLPVVTYMVYISISLGHISSLLTELIEILRKK